MFLLHKLFQTHSQLIDKKNNNSRIKLENQKITSYYPTKLTFKFL